MTNKSRLFFLSLTLLLTACSQKTVKPETSAKTSQQTQKKQAKAAHTEAVNYKKEPITVEEIPIPKPVVTTVTTPPPVVSKPRPALPPAVQSLMADAEKNTKTGNFGSASAVLERALRISPRNPELTYQLAVLKLKQSQLRLAEDLGKKASILSIDKELRKKCWLLIAQARELQGNIQGAKEAQLKAESLEKATQ